MKKLRNVAVALVLVFIILPSATQAMETKEVLRLMMLSKVAGACGMGKEMTKFQENNESTY